MIPNRRHFLAMSGAVLASVAAPRVGTGDALAEDPYRAYTFTLLIDGVEAGRFVEASGLGAEVDVIEYREGGADEQIGHLPGQVRYAPLELRFGVSRSTVLWDWLSGALIGVPERRTISVVVYEADGQTEAFRWTLSDAWVSSWQAAQLDASTDEVAIESMTIVYDRLERE